MTFGAPRLLISAVLLGAIACGHTIVDYRAAGPVFADPGDIEMTLPTRTAGVAVVQLNHPGWGDVTILPPEVADPSRISITDFLTSDCDGQPRSEADLNQMKEGECGTFKIHLNSSVEESIEETLTIKWSGDRRLNQRIPLRVRVTWTDNLDGGSP